MTKKPLFEGAQAGLEAGIAIARGEQAGLTTIKQTRGPTLRFRGELIADTQFQSRVGDEMSLEIWETEAGAFVAVSRGEMADGKPDVRAEVVEPSSVASLPVSRRSLAMRLAVMDFFRWSDRARSMVKDQLKWKLLVEVR